MTTMGARRAFVFAISWATFGFGAAAQAGQLEADHQVAEFEYRLEQKDTVRALKAFEALRGLGDESVPVRLWYSHAVVCNEIGRVELAVASIEKYLTLAGREGEHYRQALRLSVVLNDKLEAAKQRRDAEEKKRRRDEYRRERASQIAAEQVASADSLPRDPMQTGGEAPQMVRMVAGSICVRSGVCPSLPAFAVSKQPITVGEFRVFVESTKYRTDAERTPRYGCLGYKTPFRSRRSGYSWKSHVYRQSDEHPVVCVSVADAGEYARWLSAQTGVTYRLPGFVEWIYALTAGSEHANALYPERDRFSLRNEWEWPDREACETKTPSGELRLSRADCWANKVGLYYTGGGEMVQSCADEGAPLLYQENMSGCEAVETLNSSLFVLSVHQRERRGRYETTYDRNSATTIGFRVVREE